MKGWKYFKVNFHASGINLKANKAFMQRLYVFKGVPKGTFLHTIGSLQRICEALLVLVLRLFQSKLVKKSWSNRRRSRRSTASVHVAFTSPNSFSTGFSKPIFKAEVKSCISCLTAQRGHVWRPGGVTIEFEIKFKHLK